MVRPADAGARAIGHFGFFRPRFGKPLWIEASEWLLGAAAAEPA